jgi:hypothetical protein
MSYYRDVYLRSEDWQSLRKIALTRGKWKCKLCGSRHRHNHHLDVHHIEYRHLHDVKACDLRALCRPCHDEVHALLKKYPKLKSIPQKLRWRTIVYHLKPERREAISCDFVKDKEEKKKLRRLSKIKTTFDRVKNAIFDLGLITWKAITWDDSFYDFPPLQRKDCEPMEFFSCCINSKKVDLNKLGTTKFAVIKTEGFSDRAIIPVAV